MKYAVLRHCDISLSDITNISLHTGPEKKILWLTKTAQVW